jgi:hypothetical protein
LFLRRALSSRLSSLRDSFQFGQARVRNANNATRQLHQVCTGAISYGLISTAATTLIFSAAPMKKGTGDFFLHVQRS